MTEDARDLYLDLMKKVLTNLIYRDAPIQTFVYDGEPDADPRLLGRDWPSVAHTMVGLKRLDNLQYCVETVLADGVPGDLVETGVWRGGSSIFMRAVLRAHGDTARRVWVADSFEGMPEVGADSHAVDREMRLHEHNGVLAVPLEQVRANFERYGLLDDQVRFLPGWFKDTLPGAPTGRLAVIRLDGDLYESTTDALENLMPRLSPGGFVIIDDYAIDACRDAVHDYRGRYGISDPISEIDGTGVFWRHTAASARSLQPATV
uniref:8-demethyl-8-(2,3-dimethoxy-alpha-L-rhamnosyl)-tetracenomycin-C 4'-O-methyltransferase n=1 Tax=Streptomyces olivaceus TaxID=47716 RepID=ELMM3_STROV|nr:RecName: Full=8-demethyl-8-(2,3-dimethoxy-alpha-L-rhamnosyl)-tetracenomycin-C 4'-O-methyltransferase; AltName: Full=O-methyltransferase III [Streptomyces olivaceus]CAD57141.1 O-methyltransferase III [Streptomyces olivaceus]CAP12609.1 rhamnose C4'-methyltransferase [Streptomyces olivaceus]